MIEVAMVFSSEGGAIWWPTPKGNGGSIPDSRHLWDVIWDNREHLGGVAHTHPWNGEAYPSITDVTTYRAIEAGIGKPLLWPIVTFLEVGYFVHNPLTKEFVRAQTAFEGKAEWDRIIKEMRRLSQEGDQNG